MLVSCGSPSGSTATQPTQATGNGTTPSANTCPAARGPITSPIVFGTTGNLNAMAAERSGATSLSVLTGNLSAQNPAWSPDNQTLAFTFTQPSTDPNLSWLQTNMVCAWDRATGKARTLARGAGINDSLDDAAWTPDGSALLATLRVPQLDASKNYTGDTISIVRYDLAAGSMQPLAKDATSAQLSPDGKQLVYIKFDPVTYTMTLMLAQPDGSAAQPLTTGDFGSLVAPRWSPDGQQIAFVGNGGPARAARQPTMVRSFMDWLLGVRVAEAHGLPSDVWILDVATHKLRRITNKGMDDPRVIWSPDGKSLAYTGGGAGGVTLYDVVTGQSKLLTAQGNYGGLAWAGR